ncbi:DEKNAAC102272 [Brettanomyces naardenensis]|uniref:DEKNAAC102272 n=1 Tax=Brettanomyces naardenensis TaxID=13370 RepID=A0A448YL03_BRENA|nr:DEKNAAC102272 [Brettanomyces naardenensis]
MKLEKPESGRLMSELLSDSFWYKLGKMVLMLVFPDVQISAKLHGRELNSEADLENLRHLQDGGAVVGVQTEDYQNPREGSGSTTTTTVQYPASGSTSNDIGSDAESTNEEHIKKLQREIGLDIQRMLHREAMDRFQMRRVQIMKQMKVIFVYPLAYIVLWLFPFIHQCYILRDGGNSWNCYWAYTAAAFFQAFNCTVDTLVFLGREKPWTITAAKVDPYQRYSYSRWRRAVSFLPGYELGGAPASSSAPMSKSSGSGSSDGAGTIDPEKGVTEAAQQRSSSLSGIEPRSENITSQAGFNGGYGNFNLNDENVSDFVKVDTNGRPYAAQSRNGSSVDPNDSDLSLRDFLNSTLPKGDMAGGTEEQPTVSSPQGSPQKEKKRSQEQRRGSKFSWRTFSWKSSSGSSRKQSVASSIDPDTKLPELE